MCPIKRAELFKRKKKNPKARINYHLDPIEKIKLFHEICVKNTHSVLEPMRKPIIFPPLVFPEPVNSNGRMKFLKIWVRIQSFGKKK